MSSAGVALDELRTASGYVRPEGQGFDFAPAARRNYSAKRLASRSV
jgi:hypothetical protein